MPGDVARKAHPALLPGIQLEHVDLCAAWVDYAFERQAHGTALARQPTGAEQAVTIFHIAGRGEFQFLQAQGFRQIGHCLEAVCGEPDGRRQSLVQRTNLAAERAVEIALTLDLELQLLAQLALDRELQSPRLLVSRRLQRYLPLQLQRPGAAGLQSASH